ncbi:von Willebrand factor A domain-containing protein 5A-like isoform X2 [Dreissena polymorpha]|uniref:von Willebrand factor A domain-containing protein 5A-like isoform X2 n=1 Tax=Dreissena polymorpha TaxID=45954 RepID=UPI002263FCCD|nr:von Willebrand factor A domain-containing protein 5A-like isoform X2 [Dreissena polymorpha]
MLAKIHNRVSGLFGLNKGIQQTQAPCVKETVYGLKTSDSKPVTLKSVETSVTIKDCIADVVATLKYNNDESAPIYTVFTFPLGDTIGLYGFEASIDDRKIVTEVQEKNKTVDIEEENTRDHVFHCTLGTLPAGKDARLILSFVIELPHEADGRVRFILPSTLNPRYHTAGFNVTSDDDTHVQWCTVPYRLTMSAIIEGYSQIKSVKSEKLELNVEVEQGDNIAEVTLAEEFRYDHDLTFHIEYHKPFVPRLIMESGNSEKDGIFKDDLLSVSFQPELKEMFTSSGGEFILIVDRSKSMTGNHLQFAKEALLVFLKNLPANCLFNIVSFGTSYASLFPGYSVYDVTSLKKALELQRSMQADMETTDLYKVLDHVLNLDVQNPHRNIFLLTDGEVDNQSDVISLIKKQTDQNRVFVLGLGCASASLVKAVARAGNGIAEVVHRKTQIESKVMTLLQCAILNTVSDIQLVWELPPDVTSVIIPTELPNVLTVGQRLHFFAFLSGVTVGKATGSLNLKAVQNKHPLNYTIPFDMTAKASSTKSKLVHRMAARTQIISLQEEEACASKELKDCAEFYMQNDLTLKQKELRQQIVDLSRHGNIGSNFTSFLALESNSQTVCGSIELRTLKEAVDETPVVMRRKSETKSTERKSVLDTVKRAVGLQDRPKMQRAMTFENGSQGGERLPKRPMTCIEPSMAALTRRQQEALDQDDELFQVVYSQELPGNWSPSAQLNDLMNINDDKLKSIETIPGLVLFNDRAEVVYTLAVVTWLRKRKQGRKCEWSLSEMKAKLWLGEKGLGKPLEDILKEVHDVIMKT